MLARVVVKPRMHDLAVISLEHQNLLYILFLKILNASTLYSCMPS